MPEQKFPPGSTGCAIGFAPARCRHGLRWHALNRRKLPRLSYQIDTPYGSAEVKEVTTPFASPRIETEHRSIRRNSRRLSTSPARTE